MSDQSDKPVPIKPPPPTDEHLTKLPVPQDNQSDGLLRLVQPIIPVAQAFLESQMRNNEKDWETEQMSVQIDYKLRDKQLDHRREEQKESRVERREEQKEARAERRELRKWGLVICCLLTVMLIAAFFREKETAALELIKLLAIGVGAVTASHYHAKYKAAIAKKDRPGTPDEEEDDED